MSTSSFLSTALALYPASQPYAPYLAAGCERYSINTPARVAMFVAQIAVESADFNRVRENLNYKVETLLTLFSRQRISEADARKHGRIEEVRNGQKVVLRPANQIILADMLYGGEFGRTRLGNDRPGDGSKFIGRGLKQLTGRDNYGRCSKNLLGTYQYLIEPELLEQPQHAALSACWFWDTNKLNAYADRQDCDRCSIAVNGGENGKDRRRFEFQRVLAALT